MSKTRSTFNISVQNRFDRIRFFGYLVLPPGLIVIVGFKAVALFSG